MDLAISQWIIEHLHNPFLNWLMPIITVLGDNGYIWIALCLVLLARKKTRRMGIYCTLSLALAFLTGEVIIKNLVQRARPFTYLPDLELLIPPPGSTSFPSGHSASSFATATAVFLKDKKWGVWALLLAALIALSRLYLVVHFLTDIVGGILLGIASAWVAKWLLDRKLPQN